MQLAAVQEAACPGCSRPAKVTAMVTALRCMTQLMQDNPWDSDCRGSAEKLNASRQANCVSDVAQRRSACLAKQAWPAARHMLEKGLCIHRVETLTWTGHGILQ